jgi:hypothetical protein
MAVSKRECIGCAIEVEVKSNNREFREVREFRDDKENP